MLGWAMLFALIALAAAILGFSILAGTAATILKWVFVGFVVLFVISLFTGHRGSTTV